MRPKYRTGLQRFQERFPHYRECLWKPIAENERPVTEGRLRSCLFCDGMDEKCESYYIKGNR